MKRSKFLAALGLVILMGLAACGNTAGKPCDGEFLAAKAQLCVDFDSLGFGQEFGTGTYIGTEPPRSLSITNGGITDLVLESVTTNGDPAFRYVASWDGGIGVGAVIKGKQKAFMTVYFKPAQAKAYTGNITIKSNAENAPSKSIGVSGCGVPADGGSSPCYCKAAGVECTSTRASLCCSGVCNVTAAKSTCQ